MTPLRAALFDFDGTLCDSIATIIRLVQLACEEIGVPVPTTSTIRGNIGRGFENLAEDYTGGDDQLAAQLFQTYRQINSREIAADDFFQGMFTTALEEGEIITEVKFPVPQKANYQKFVQPASRFALVGVFVAKFADGVRVAVTGASGEGVFRWTEAEAALSKDFTAAALDGVAAPSADGMISDLHGTGAYRAHLVKVMTARAVAAA